MISERFKSATLDAPKPPTEAELMHLRQQLADAQAEAARVKLELQRRKDADLKMVELAAQIEKAVREAKEYKQEVYAPAEEVVIRKEVAFELAQKRFSQRAIEFYRERGIKPFQDSGLIVTEDADVQVSDEAAAISWLKSNPGLLVVEGEPVIRESLNKKAFNKLAKTLKLLGLPWLTVQDRIATSVPRNLDAYASLRFCVSCGQQLEIGQQCPNCEETHAV